MSQNTCCVSGCTTHVRPLHSFPLKLPHLFMEWIRRVGLVTTETDKYVAVNRKVCDAHFNSHNKNSDIPMPSCKRLRFCSAPTINVPGFTGEPTKENSFCFPPSYFKTDINKQTEDSSLPKANESSKSSSTTATTGSNENSSICNEIVNTNESIKRNIESECSRKETLVKNKEPTVDPMSSTKAVKQTVDSEPVITEKLVIHKNKGFQSSNAGLGTLSRAARRKRHFQAKKLKTIISLLDVKSKDSESMISKFDQLFNAEELDTPFEVEEFDELPPSAPREHCNPASIPLICRVCASSNAYLIPIYGHEGKECDLGRKISSYLPLQVSEGDSVCFPCALTVISFHQLMINCKTANALFSLQPDDIQTKVIDPVAQNYDLLWSEQSVSNPTHATELSETTKLGVTGNSGYKRSNMEVCPLRWKEIIAATNIHFLTCHLCYESFPEFNQLKDHLGDCEKIVCKKCRVMFQNTEELNKHTKGCKVYDCNMCTRSFTRYTTLISHTRAMHPSITCPLCTKRFINDLECEIHKTTDHNFLCECCNKTFPSSLPVMKHRLSIMPYGALMCLSCFGVSHFIPKPDNQFIIEDKKSNSLTTKFVENCSIPRSIEEGSTDNHADMDAGENNATITMTTTANGNGLRELNDHIYTKNNTTAICMHCSKIFTCENYLKLHIIKYHPTEPAYGCENCYNRFPSEKHLKSHCKNQCPLTCSVCGTVVQGTRMLRMHKRKDHQLEKKTLPCNQCNKVFKTKSILRAHVKGVHQGIKKKKTLCVVCGDLIYPGRFKEHYARHHSTEPVRCNYCLKTVQSNLLKQHFNDNHLKGQFKCAMCSRVFVQKRFLVRHLMRMHNSSSSKSCVFCNAPFTNAQSCDRHIANHHKNVSYFVKLNNFDEYKCLHCEVVFDYTNMIDHKKMLEEKYGKLVKKPAKQPVKKRVKKTNIKPILNCNICGKKYASPLTLQNHINDVHIALLKFQCSYCPRSFKRQSHKEIHERIHTDERPYSCAICHRKFRQRGDCNRHVARHCNSLDRKQFVIFEKPKKGNVEQIEFDQMDVEQEVEIDHQMF